MVTKLESNTDEIKIIRKGRKERGFFFGILGILFQIIFLWGYWSFLDETGSWAIFWLTIIYSEFFPFTFISFVFGTGCILIAVREFGWEETLIIRTNLFEEIPGLQKGVRLFRWLRTTTVLNTQIAALRLHSIQLDKVGINKVYQIELDYQEVANSSLKTIKIYGDNEDKLYITAQRLIERIHGILSLPKEIEKTESTALQLDKKKKREENKSKIT